MDYFLSKLKIIYINYIKYHSASKSNLDPTPVENKENKILTQEKSIILENLRDYELRNSQLEALVKKLEKNKKDLELEREENLRDIEILRNNNDENFEKRQALEIKELELQTIQDLLTSKDQSIELLTKDHNDTIRVHLDEIRELKVSTINFICFSLIKLNLYINFLFFRKKISK